MVAIARGLMAKPKCLLLDEPTLGLAPVIVDEISLTVMKLARDGMTILLAEQNAAMALEVASRAYVLAAGAISAQGTPEQLKASPIVEQLYFGATPSEAVHA
jgi:branched-chain amino acid transport system ATP-binding protein